MRNATLDCDVNYFRQFVNSARQSDKNVTEFVFRDESPVQTT